MTAIDLTSYLEGLMAQTAELDYEWNDGPVWNSAEFERDFEVIDQPEPTAFVAVIRKADGQLGTLEIVDGRYFNYEPA